MPAPLELSLRTWERTHPERLHRMCHLASSMERFVPVFAINRERLIVMALKKQCMGKVLLDEDQVVAIRFLDPVANFIG